MLRLTANLKGYGQLDVRYVRMQGDYPIVRYRVGNSRGDVLLQGEDCGKALTMPDAQRSMESLVTDLIDAADRFDPEAPGWLYSGYISSDVAQWAHDARDELVALQGTLEPSIVLVEL